MDGWIARVVVYCIVPVMIIIIIYIDLFIFIFIYYNSNNKYTIVQWYYYARDPSIHPVIMSGRMDRSPSKVDGWMDGSFSWQGALVDHPLGGWIL